MGLPESLLGQLKAINAREVTPKPHKLMMLLGVARNFATRKYSSQDIYFDEALRDQFTKVFSEFSCGNDRNRPHTPFFHLRSSPFWKLIPKAGQEVSLGEICTVGGPGLLATLVDHVHLSDELYDIMRDPVANRELQAWICDRLNEIRHPSQMDDVTQENGQNGGGVMVQRNDFVYYLNTLHSSDANNKGALAESQAKEPLFTQLQVNHPWASAIFDTLTTDGGNSVILSGHAGDGKSTIAIEVLRKLLGLSQDALLPDGLKKIDRIDYVNRAVTIVKDLSECTTSERDAIFSGIINGERYLLISNTGTLLDFFKSHSTEIARSPIEVEDAVLTSLDSNVASILNLGANFTVYNLAQCDNVALGIELLRKMVLSNKWNACDTCQCKGGCPILANRNILQKYSGLLFERIGILYYRAYAYGERLTMRQISAHFAYMLTAGLDCDEVFRLASERRLRPDGCYSFINRFWGDDGNDVKAQALQMKAIRVFREQPFNAHFSPSLERRFWTEIDEEVFDLGVPELAAEAKRMLRLSHRTGQGELLRDAAFARRAWRRYVYFLFATDGIDVRLKKDFDEFVADFLDSPMALKCRAWQMLPSSFSSKSLLVPLFSVLQEEFCGYLPPEGSVSGGELFVTLRQNNTDITQSAQLVLKKIIFSDSFKIHMTGESIKFPTLSGVDDLEGVSLVLDLPFLDYVVMRQSGRIGRGLSLSYRDRLEKLANQIIEKTKGRVQEHLLILRRSENGALSTLKLNVTDDDTGLEVM